jgi:integrase
MKRKPSGIASGPAAAPSLVIADSKIAELPAIRSELRGITEPPLSTSVRPPGKHILDNCGLNMNAALLGEQQGSVQARWGRVHGHRGSFLTEASDLCHSFSLHALRHSHVSVLIRSGVDILTISRRRGHAQASITLNVYGHLFGSADREAADAIAGGAETNKSVATRLQFPICCLRRLR